MRILYAPNTAELEIEATKAESRLLAIALLKDGSTMTASIQPTEFYPVALGGIQVKHLISGRIAFRISDTLEISGSKEHCEELSSLLSATLNSYRPGDHRHFEDNCFDSSTSGFVLMLVE